MNTLQQVSRNNHCVSHQRKHKKRGIQLFLAYTLRAMIVALGLIILILLICGCLYIQEHWFPAPHENQGNVPDYFESPDGIADGSVPTGAIAKSQFTVALDAGHGGTQAGCEFEGILEKDITLSVTLLLKEKLEESGVNVILTRDGDQDVSLDERCAIANSADADLFVSIHCNSYTNDTSIMGFEGYYYQDADGKLLADLIFDALENYPSIKTRSVKEEDYKVLRETEMPSVLLEIGYLSNATERDDLQSSEYQNMLAHAMFNGIIAMLHRN